MSPFSALAQAGAAALLGVHGEPLTLSSGTVRGIFDPVGDAPAPWGSEVGLTVRLSQQPSPWALLRAGDEEGLALGDLVQARGVAYRVTAVGLARDGLVRVELAAEPAATPEDAFGGRWR